MEYRILNQEHLAEAATVAAENFIGIPRNLVESKSEQLSEEYTANYSTNLPLYEKEEVKKAYKAMFSEKIRELM